MAADENGKILNRLSVLLIDDEELVCLTTADMLEAEGAEVITAGTAEVALAALSASPRFDLVISDYRMAGIDRSVLADEIAALFPSKPLLIISGAGIIDSSETPYPYLSKPFRPEQLIQAVVAALSGDAGNSD